MPGYRVCVVVMPSVWIMRPQIMAAMWHLSGMSWAFSSSMVARSSGENNGGP